MIELGRINTLRIAKEVDFGVYLDGGEAGEILLPFNYIPEGAKLGDEVDVLIYRDSEDRLIATNETPYAFVDDFALLECVDVSSVGAFLDWGLSKDILVPFREQKTKMQKGRSYIVYIYVDKSTDRIVASAKIDKFISEYQAPYEAGDKVEALVVDKTDIGYKIIVDNLFWGVLYENEVFTDLKIGQKLEAYIKKVRDDGKIDLTIHRFGYRKVEDGFDPILHKLEENNGVLYVSDKSSPDEIYEMFEMSKKTFKKALGGLFRQKLIMIYEDRIEKVN
ncbi:MAG: S1 RNA-binding domain-containing protein [Bacteroidales bacterium]|jgi:predicted RNA-binding protein (virulence factor B family)|nr:GntR family transcriptional regulator [Bacteroidales bacterium]